MKDGNDYSFGKNPLRPSSKGNSIMPLSSLLKSAAGTCPFCHQKAGILSREHPECRRAHQAGWHEMVQLAAQAAGFPTIQQVQNTST